LVSKLVVSDSFLIIYYLLSASWAVPTSSQKLWVMVRQSLGSRRERMGQQEHATYGILFESYLQNTGDFLVDEKGDGQ
jgi:hypothetical protein